MTEWHVINNSAFKQKIIDDCNAGTSQYDLCKKCQMPKVINQFVSKYKTKGTVETEHFDGLQKKSTHHTDRIIIRYVKKNRFASARDTSKITVTEAQPAKTA